MAINRLFFRISRQITASFPERIGYSLKRNGYTQAGMLFVVGGQLELELEQRDSCAEKV